MVNQLNSYCSLAPGAKEQGSFPLFWFRRLQQACIRALQLLANLRPVPVLPFLTLCLSFSVLFFFFAGEILWVGKLQKKGTMSFQSRTVVLRRGLLEIHKSKLTEILAHLCGRNANRR